MNEFYHPGISVCVLCVSEVGFVCGGVGVAGFSSSSSSSYLL